MKCKKFNTQKEWLDFKKNFITASSGPALLGLSPYSTKYDLYWSFFNKIPPQEQTSIMEDGLYDEYGNLKWLEDNFKDYNFYHNSKDYSFYYDEELRLGATPDIIAEHKNPVVGRGVIQMKMVNTFAFKNNWLDSDKNVIVPEYIKLQTLIEAYCTNSNWAKVLVHVPYESPSRYILDVNFIDGLIDKLLKEVKQFWYDVEHQIEPEPDYSKNQGSILQVNKPVPDKVADLSSNNRIYDLIKTRSILSEQKKSSDENIKAIDAEVAHILGDAEVGILRDGEKISWITTERKPYTVQGGISKRLKYPKIKFEGDQI